MILSNDLYKLNILSLYLNPTPQPKVTGNNLHLHFLNTPFCAIHEPFFSYRDQIMPPTTNKEHKV